MNWLLEAWPWIELGGRLLAVAMTVLLIQSHKEPRAMLAWILSFFLLPYVGPALYLILGSPRLELRARKRARIKQLGPSHRPEGPTYVPDEPLDSLLTHMLGEFNPFPARPGNRIDLSHDGEAFFRDLFAAIAGARRRIHLEFYLIRDDATGHELRELLMQKAAEGVEVRLLYDHVGSLFFHRRYVEPLRRAGVQVMPFLPINLLRRQFHINFRNHRKIVTIDGELGFTGGMNVGDEYRTGHSAWGTWRDLGVRVQGPLVGDMDRVFLDDWWIAAHERVPADPYPEPLAGGTAAQLVPGGPDDPYEPIRLLFTTLLSRVNTSLVASTPYFIPDVAVLSLIHAARVRNVHVDMILPAVGNHWWVHQATESFCGDLLRFHIQPWIFQSGMVHTKAMVFDERLGVVGSPNFDVRSFQLNFEVAILLYDEPDVRALSDELALLMRQSRVLDEVRYRHRPVRRRLLNGLARTFGPVL